MSTIVRLLGASDIEALLEHLERQDASNGRGDTLLFGPRPPGTPFDRRETFRTQFPASWAKGVDAPGWGRMWGAIADDGTIVGHAALRARDEPSTGHRAVASAGVDEGARRRGLGRALMREAMLWAESQPTLVWIDLYVFEHNHPARALYREMGFVPVSQVVDLFRVAGMQVTDIFMTKRLRP